jgi:dipeptidase D
MVREQIDYREAIKGLETEIGPQRLWELFAVIANTPRPSGGEEELDKKIDEFAQARRLTIETRAGSTLIELPATKGFEGKSGIVLHAHKDMVAVPGPKQSADSPALKGVQLACYKDDDGLWVSAKDHQTSLGADNGIGMASILSIIDENIPHGPLAILLTKDEERGLRGAKELSANPFDLSNYQYLVTTDSEKEGVGTISSAGGRDTIVKLPVNREKAKGKHILEIELDGLLGGHSGVNIAERGNAISLATEILTALRQPDEKGQIDINLVSMEGGVQRNAIPSSVKVVIAVDPSQSTRVARLIETAAESLRTARRMEQGMRVHVNYSDKYDSMMSAESTDKVLQLLSYTPNGVIAMSKEVAGLVETSNNIAAINTGSDSVTVEMMSRSSVDESLASVTSQIKELAESYGASVEQTEPYPGWKPEPESAIIALANRVYQNLFGKDMRMLAIHAGLECGWFRKMWPHIQILATGATIENAHSEKERVEMTSVGHFYQFLKTLVVTVATE